MAFLTPDPLILNTHRKLGAGMKLSPRPLIATLTVALFALAGCSTGSDSSSFTVNEISPEGIQGAEAFQEGFVNTGDSLQVLLGGSGSCPPEIESGTVDGDKATLKLVELPADQVCTADLRMYAFDVSFGVSVKDVKTVEVTSSTGSLELPEIK